MCTEILVTLVTAIMTAEKTTRFLEQTYITVELENTTTYFYLAIWFNIIQFFVFLNPLYFLTFIFFLSLHFSRPAERQLMYANLNKIEI